jgi:peptidyl-Lys metalloendopeptidase
MLSLLIALIASSASVLSSPGLTVTLLGDMQVTDVDNFRVITTIKNTGNDTLNLLNSPDSVLTPDWATDIFNVDSEYGPVPFKGVKVRSAFTSLYLSGPIYD